LDKDNESQFALSDLSSRRDLHGQAYMPPHDP